MPKGRPANPFKVFQQKGKNLIELSSGRKINCNSAGQPIAIYDRQRYEKQLNWEKEYKQQQAHKNTVVTASNVGLEMMIEPS